MKKINQINISESVYFFSEKIKNKYNLKDYNDPTKPAIFWGMYRDEDIYKISKHNSKSVIVWRGSDAKMCWKYIDILKQLKDVTHISISTSIQESLNKNGIKSKLIPIKPNIFKKNLKPRGNKIYFYYGKETEKAYKFYGGEIVNQLMKLLPYEFILTTKETYNEEELEKIYEDCFIGLRLTDHDGIANTVCDMGLMGRRCIHNGDIPNCIKYTDINDIITSIELEYNLRHNDNSEIVDYVYNYLNISDDWLYV